MYARVPMSGGDVRHTLTIRRATIVAAFALALLVTAGPAWATSFTAAREPQTITKPNVTTAEGFGQDFVVTIGPALTCPAGQPVPYKVTFSDPTGSSSTTTQDCAATEGPVTTT